MAKSPAEKIAELEATQKQIANRIKDEKAKLHSQARKDENRRKIIYGSVVLAHAEHDPEFKNLLETIIKNRTTRDVDRKFLGLPLLKKKAANQR